MELILLIGIQATGKSSFYCERFFRTHVRINGDMLTNPPPRRSCWSKPAWTERRRLWSTIMNLTREQRAAYIGPARAAGFKVGGYFFESQLAAALLRNARRDAPERRARRRGAQRQRNPATARAQRRL